MTATSTFKTGGMHCSSCSMLITMTVEEIDGVKAVACDHATGKTVVMFDDAVTSDAEIRAAVEAVGYTAEIDHK